MPLKDYINSLSINKKEYNFNSEKEKTLTNLLIFGKANDISNYYSNSLIKIIIFSFLLICFFFCIILIIFYLIFFFIFNIIFNYIKYKF